MQRCTTVVGNTACPASGKPGQAVYAGDEEILDAARLQFAQDTGPELGAFAAITNPVA